MQTLENRTIGEIVAEDYRTAQVFKNYGLDFCCGGRRTVAEACDKKGVDLKSIANDLAMLEDNGHPGDNYKDWSPSFLVDYVVNNHHNFVRNKLPEIHMYAQKVARVHGGTNPENVKILSLFEQLEHELREHMNKEEQILFPYIKQLTESKRKGEQPATPHFGKAEHPIRMMEEEHEVAGALMDEIRKLSNDFTPPEGACATYRVLYANLRDFRDDLHKHVHLENNILFPKAIELEKKLN